MAEIITNTGLVCSVDQEDFEALSAHSWGVRRSGKNTYAAAWVEGAVICMHRFLMSPPKGMVVDHINGNGLDNRRVNLRVCSQKENLWNQRKRGARSRFKGVSPVVGSKLGKWAAKITVDGKLRHVGTFDTEEEAAQAYDSAARSLRGAFANTNEALVAEYLRCHPLALRRGA